MQGFLFSVQNLKLKPNLVIVSSSLIPSGGFASNLRLNLTFKLISLLNIIDKVFSDISL